MSSTRLPPRIRWIGAAALLLAIAIAGWWVLRPVSGNAEPASKIGGRRLDPATRAMPVAAATAVSADVPVRLSALGTVTPRSSVTVRSRVDGPLMQVLFKEGDRVKAGQLLAQIDPRPYEVALAQAQAQLARDRASLQGARIDLARYEGLMATDSIPRQQLDQQHTTVGQFEGAVAVDAAAVDNARLQLSFTRITAPVSGRVGLRLVDIGNLVHASDATGLAVITQMQPADVVFSLPQDQLPEILRQLHAGAHLPVEAFDRDGRRKLASGNLLTVDNVVDPTTGTAKLKATFDNTDDVLIANEFVNVRLEVATLKGAIVVPVSAVQRGAPGTFVYVLGADSTVGVRKVTVAATEGERVAIGAGLQAGERVVADGGDKLRDGMHVEVVDQSAPAAAAPVAAERKGRGPGRVARDGAQGKPPGQ